MEQANLINNTARYHRQMILPEVGPQGQARLNNARVLCVGAGGLGSPVMLYLAAAGVGTLGIIDSDTVSLSNLHRQIGYRMADIGLSKVAVMASDLRALNPEIEIFPYKESFSIENAVEIMSKYDMVVDATDNLETKYLINDVAVKLGVPVVYGAIQGYEGHVCIFWAKKGPCYRCLYPSLSQEVIPNCEQMGVLGPVAGIIGSIQSLEVIKLILDCNDNIVPNIGRLTVLNAATLKMLTYKVTKKKNCSVCSKSAEKIVLESAKSKKNHFASGDTLNEYRDAIWLDVREYPEWQVGHIPGATHLPLSKLIESTQCLDKLCKAKRYILYCQQGVRSQQAAQILLTLGFDTVLQLKGGYVEYLQHQN